VVVLNAAREEALGRATHRARVQSQDQRFFLEAHFRLFELLDFDVSLGQCRAEM